MRRSARLMSVSGADRPLYRQFFDHLWTRWGGRYLQNLLLTENEFAILSWIECNGPHLIFWKLDMIPDDLFDALACGARFAVHEAWDHAFSLKSGLPDEIDHLYAMTTVGIREIGANWSPILSTVGTALRVTGVFCHQTPKAHYTHPIAGLKRPELGDLLVVHEHKTARPGGPDDISRRAVLVQGKMVDQGVPGGGKVDQYQEYLYEHWPDFELKGRGPGNTGFLPGQRDFRSGGLDAGRYGLIERDPHTHPMPPYFPFCCGLPWTYSEPRKPVRSAGGEDAGAFIANMLYDTSWMRGRTALIPATPLALSTGC